MRVLSLLALIVLVSGCKLKITVPAGGSVVSASGSYSCAAGKMCEIDVVDIFFDETFIAQADGDHRFVAWQKGTNTLCTKSTKRCKLSTSAFAGKPALMAILQSDRVFHLKPFFAKSGGTGPLQRGPMKACLNEDRLKAGYSSDILRQLYDDDGSSRGQQRTELTVDGFTSYRGESVLKQTEFVSQTGALSASYEFIFYSRIDLPRSRATVLAADQESITPNRQFTKSTLTPGFLQRFDLAVGETYTTTYTIDVTFPNGESPPVKQRISTQITYEGIEDISTPAGSFKACRIHRFDDLDGQVSEAYHWIGRGNGVLLRESDGNFVTQVEVISGTVNGATL